MTQKLLSKGYGLGLVAIIVVFLAPQAMKVHAGQPPSPGQTLTANQLDDLVAPIALYPDPLISQILVAATYPLEIVEASQWLQRNPGLTGAALTQAVEQQDWDPSVQALVPFPDVLKHLNEDIGWTTNLGNAFLAQEADVMDAIQRMRAKAAQAGKLADMPQQRVTQVNDSGQIVYVIIPANPDVIYVPIYDPVWIWGAPLYYPYARWYYAPHAPVLYFSRPIAINVFFGTGWRGWNNWGWRPAWTTHNVYVNNTFIHRQNFNSTHLSNFTGSAPWSHDAAHRQGVPYPTPALKEHFRSDVRDNLRPRDIQRGGGTPLPAPGPAPITPRPQGGRELAPSSPNRERGAFGGIENGDASRLHSDHGYSSLGPNRVNPNPAPAPPRGGGGGPAQSAVRPAAPARGGGQPQPQVHPIQPARSSPPAASIPRAPQPQHQSPPVHSAPPPHPSHQAEPSRGGGSNKENGNSRGGR
jgi:hypothetical protein